MCLRADMSQAGGRREEKGEVRVSNKIRAGAEEIQAQAGALS